MRTNLSKRSINFLSISSLSRSMGISPYEMIFKAYGVTDESVKMCQDYAQEKVEAYIDNLVNGLILASYLKNVTRGFENLGEVLKKTIVQAEKLSNLT